MSIFELKTKNLILRKTKLSDANFFAKFLNDKEVTFFLPYQDKTNKKEQEKEIRKILRKKKLFWTIVLKENNKIIGFTALRKKEDNKKVTLSLVIGDKNEWGKSYGKEVLENLLDFVFKKSKYNRFELYVSVENKRAINLYKKIGFKIDGILRENKWNKKIKKFEDQMLMSILKKEYKK